jgi:isopentenyldiphosphate isomerase
MTGRRLQPASTNLDLLPVVDERDEVVGIATRRAVHEQRLLHRAVHVCVTDPQGRLWLQRRAAAKDTYPGWWDLSATGHVDPDESYDAAARRELREELGIDAIPVFLAKMPPTERTGFEFHAIYHLEWPHAIKDHNPNEVSEMRPLALGRLIAMLREGEAFHELTPGIADVMPALLPALGLRELLAELERS